MSIISKISCCEVGSVESAESPRNESVLPPNRVKLSVEAPFNDSLDVPSPRWGDDVNDSLEPPKRRPLPARERTRGEICEDIRIFLNRFFHIFCACCFRSQPIPPRGSSTMRACCCQTATNSSREFCACCFRSQPMGQGGASLLGRDT